jgi:hypothetical protein
MTNSKGHRLVCPHRGFEPRDLPFSKRALWIRLAMARPLPLSYEGTHQPRVVTG